MRITIDGERVKTTMQQRIAHSDWDAKRGLPRPIARTQQITSFLEMMRTKANQAFIDLSRSYETVTAIMVREAMLGRDLDGTVRTMLSAWDEHNEEVKSLIGKDMSYTLYQKHVTVRNHFADYLEKDKGMKDIPLKAMRRALILHCEVIRFSGTDRVDGGSLTFRRGMRIQFFTLRTPFFFV